LLEEHEVGGDGGELLPHVTIELGLGGSLVSVAWSRHTYEPSLHITSLSAS
jgi:hypothetical protein